MLRRSQHWLLSFETLAASELVSFTRQRDTPASVAEAVQRWQRTAPKAPLPLRVAAPLVVSKVLDGAVEDAAAELIVHPRRQALFPAVMARLCATPSPATLAQLDRLLALVRPSDEAGAVQVLKAMAQLVSASLPHEASSVVSSGPDDTVATAQTGVSQDVHGGGTRDTSSPQLADRLRVRHALLRHIRFVPGAAATLLRPLCDVTAPAVAHEVNDVVDTLHIAAKGTGVLHPDDLAAVLMLVAACGEASRVAALWGWMQYTSASWDVGAASAAMVALAKLGRLQDAVVCMQNLAEAGHHPTPAAQLAVLQLLAQLHPPLAEYAKQLVAYWYPRQSTALWGSDDTAVVEVGMTLLSLLHRCHDADGVRDALIAAHTELVSQSPQRLFAFLASPIVGTVTADYASSPRHSRAAPLGQEEQPAVDDAVVGLLYRLPMAYLAEPNVPSLSCPPSVLAGIALIGSALGKEVGVLEVFSRLTVDSGNFVHVSRTLAEAPLAPGASSVDRLRWIESLAAAVGAVVPEEVRMWMELVESNSSP